MTARVPEASVPASAGVVAAPIQRSFHDEEKLGKAVDFQLMKKLWPFVRPHSGPLVVSMLMLPVSSWLVTLRPMVMRDALDRSLAQHDVSIIDRAGFVYLGLVAADYAFRFAQLYTMQLVGARAMADLRSHAFGFLQRAKLGFFDDQPVGRLVTRVTNDVDAVGELFASGVLNAVGDLLSLAFIIQHMLSMDVQLTGIALAALPILAVLVNLIRGGMRDAFRDIRARTARLNSYMGEQVQGVAVTQAYGRERACQEEFDHENAAYRDANYRSIMYDAGLDAIVEGVATICMAAVLWFAGVRGATLGGIVVTFGTFVAFTEYLTQFFGPIRDLSTRYTTLQSAMAGAERVFGLLDTRGVEDAVKMPASEIAAPGDPTIALELDHVRFGYRSGVDILKGVSLFARQGERVAIVGATGAGKSTIASLVLRLYERTSGTVRVFGRDVRDYSRTELRQKFAVVPQDVILFTGTIATNVAMGQVVDRARVREALTRVGALDLFEKREGGLDAPVAERGVGLSAGERQLVAFARALYRDPPILILDEATASIDSDTEARLQRALEAVLEGRTSLVIAHRLSTIRTADRVVVLHQGKVAEVGTHDELVAKGGLYAKLYTLQFSREGQSEALL
jgi:ATP-binding cassette subfamily B multidrug efflux pump